MVTWQLTIDANDPARLAAFWAPLLDYEVQPPPEEFASYREWYVAMGVPEDELTDMGDDYADRLRDPSGVGPPIWFQIVPETKAGKNRLHLDVYPGGRDPGRPMSERIALVDERVVLALATGAAIRNRVHTEDRYCVGMSDPEGNEFCVS